MPFPLNSPVPDIEVPAFPTPFGCPAQSHWETQFALRNTPLVWGSSNCTLNQISATLPPAPLLGCLECCPGSSTSQHSYSGKHMYIPPPGASRRPQGHKQERAVLRTLYALAFIYLFKCIFIVAMPWLLEATRGQREEGKAQVQMQLCDNHTHMRRETEMEWAHWERRRQNPKLKQGKRPLCQNPSYF